MAQEAIGISTIYKYLWMLMTEADPGMFQEMMEGFLETWMKNLWSTLKSTMLIELVS